MVVQEVIRLGLWWCRVEAIQIVIPSILRKVGLGNGHLAVVVSLGRNRFALGILSWKKSTGIANLLKKHQPATIVLTSKNHNPPTTPCGTPYTTPPITSQSPHSSNIIISTSDRPPRNNTPIPHIHPTTTTQPHLYQKGHKLMNRSSFSTTLTTTSPSLSTPHA